MRCLESAHLGTVLRAAVHHVRRDDAVVHDPGGIVDIGKKEIQRPQALGQTGLQQPPLIGGQYTRHAVHGDDALFGFGVPVHGEGDPFGGKRTRYPFLYAFEFLDGKMA